MLASPVRHKTKTLCGDVEGRVKLAAKVFKRNCRSQLDNLRLIVMPLQAREEFVVNLLVGMRHTFGVFESNALGSAEQGAVAPSRDLDQLPFTIIIFPHTEGIDINSEGASVHQRNAQTDQRP
jgi:hypothetical protein